MPRSLLIAVAAGVLSAVMFVSAVFVPVAGFIVGQVSPVPLMIAALVLGPTAAMVAGLSGLVALLVGGPFPLAIAFAVSDLAPTAVVAWLALRCRPAPDGSLDWYPPGRLLGALALTAVGLLASAAVLAGMTGDGLQAQVREGLEAVLRMLAPEATEAERSAVTDTWVSVLPGGVMVSWLFRAALSGVAAQWVATRMGRALRPTPHYADMALPDWFLPLLAGALAVGWLLPGETGWLAGNAALVLAAPYLAQGLTVIHAAVRLTKHSGAWLTAFYVLFLFASGLAVVAMIGLGLVDHVTRLRQRLRGDRRLEEE
ncbi:MAG: DUF2232 domain-containing protein [Rhodospirillaceae bacterium]